MFMMSAMRASIRAGAPWVRRDRSGLITAKLTRALEDGEMLRDDAALIHSPTDLSSFEHRHQLWVRGCLVLLLEEFEPETVEEFRRVSACVRPVGEAAAASRAASTAMRDSVELLRGLRATLNHQSGHLAPAHGD